MDRFLKRTWSKELGDGGHIQTAICQSESLVNRVRIKASIHVPTGILLADVDEGWTLRTFSLDLHEKLGPTLLAISTNNWVWTRTCGPPMANLVEKK